MGQEPREGGCGLPRQAPLRRPGGRAPEEEHSRCRGHTRSPRGAAAARRPFPEALPRSPGGSAGRPGLHFEEGGPFPPPLRRPGGQGRCFPGLVPRASGRHRPLTNNRAESQRSGGGRREGGEAAPGSALTGSGVSTTSLTAPPMQGRHSPMAGPTTGRAGDP